MPAAHIPPAPPDRPTFHIPAVARLAIALVRAVPPAVTVAFAAFSVGSAIAGQWGQSLAALAMSGMALSVAVRARWFRA